MFLALALLDLHGHDTGWRPISSGSGGARLRAMGRVVHFEIHADDPERAVKFYRGVFGWDVTKWDGPVDYWLVDHGARLRARHQRRHPAPHGRRPG